MSASNACDEAGLYEYHPIEQHRFLHVLMGVFYAQK